MTIDDERKLIRLLPYSVLIAPLLAIGIAGAMGAKARKPHEQFTGTAEKVIDGDTAWVNRGTLSTKVRLHSVDAPEHDQPYGAEARDYLAKLLDKKQVTCTVRQNSYDRLVCDVLVDGKSINAGMVAAGFAWVDPRYNRDKTLRELQIKAKAEKRGLWADDTAIPPWDWRKGKH